MEIRAFTYAVRTLVRTPGFSLLTLCVFALGTSIAVTALWASELLGQAAGIHTGEKLAYISQRSSKGLIRGLSYEQFTVLHEALPTGIFDGLLAYSKDVAVVGRENDTDVLAGEIVSGDYFNLLGARATKGRLLSAPDDLPTAPPVVVISHDLWTRRFHKAESTVGQILRLDPAASGPSSATGAAYSIVGIAEESFRGSLSPWEKSDYWVTIASRAADYRCEEPTAPRSWYFNVQTKIAKTVTVVQAEESLLSIDVGARTKPDGAAVRLEIRENAGYRLPFDSRGDILPERVAMALQLLSACVLIVAAVNVGGMLISRASSRAADSALRSMLGARPWHVLQPLIYEVLILALAGEVFGLLIGKVFVAALVGMIPAKTGLWGSQASIALDVSFHGSIYLWLTILALVTAAGAAVFPARTMLRTRPGSLVPANTSTVIPPAKYSARLLLAPQVAISVILLTPALTLAVEVFRFKTTSLGYREDGIAFSELALVRPAECERSKSNVDKFLAAREALGRRLSDRLEEVVGQGTAVAMSIPTTRQTAWIAVNHNGTVQLDKQVDANAVSSGYFDLLGIQLRLGRLFRRSDTADAEQVAVVSESLAARFWPGSPAVGQLLAFHGPGGGLPTAWIKVVGVVSDIRPANTAIGTIPMVYRPIDQWGVPLFALARSQKTSIGALVQTIGTVVSQLNQPILTARTGTLTSAVDEFRLPLRLAAIVTATVSILAVLLSLTAVYGLTSFQVSNRTRELGVRAALGARRRSLVFLVLQEVIRMSAFGAAIGTGAAFVLVRFIAGRLLPLQSPLVITLLVPMIVCAAAVVAAAVPAIRGVSLDPVRAIRQN